MTNLTLRLSSAEKKLISDYAAFEGVSMTDLVLNSTLEKIEQILDIDTYKAAMNEYKENPSDVMPFSEYRNQVLHGER